MLDFLTGGKSKEAEAAYRKALESISNVATPTAAQLTIPELEELMVSTGMNPAQMQAFLQDSNAFNDQQIDQTGTAAQKAALSRLAEVAQGGAEGDATSRAQVAQVNQDSARELAGQRGAIEQAAQARGVPPGLLAAALQSQQAGQGRQDAHMAALTSQDQAYQRALAAMAQGGALGGQLQGQQNLQGNTVAQAQNAMQQFNAANQQNASAQNAQMSQQAGMYNADMANKVGQANTMQRNQRTQANAAIPQQMFENSMQKATGQANAYGGIGNLQQQQGQQNAGALSGLLGTAGTIVGGIYGGPAGAAAGGAIGNKAGNTIGNNQNKDDMMMNCGGMVKNYSNGGSVEGQSMMPGDSPMNDTIDARLSPGEAVIPRSVVAQNPEQVMGLLSQAPSGIDVSDVVTILKAMRELRGAQ